MNARIRNLREDNDFRQIDIARQLNITQQQYQRYESGKTPIPIDVAIALAKLYDVSVDYLLGLTDKKKAPSPPLNERTKKALSYFNRLNEENQDYILGEMIKLHREQEEKVKRKKDIG